MRRFLSLLVGFALLIAACGGDGDEAESTQTTVAASETTAPSQDAAATTATPAATTTEAPATTTTAATSTGGTDVSSSPLLSALAQSNEITSARMEGSMVIVGSEGAPAGSELAIEFSGAFDNTTGSSSMVMDMSGIAEAAGEELPAGFEDLFGEMEIRTIGDTAYMRFGMFAMLGVETEWVSMPSDDAGTTAGSFGANPANPGDLMGAFAHEGAEVVELGSEQVRGVNTTHYRVTVDVEAMLAEADEEARAELENLGPLPGDGMWPVEFWIGDDGNVYRMLMDIDGTTEADTGFESMQMIWEMYDFGADVEIEPPPADQVTDGSDLAGFLTG